MARKYRKIDPRIWGDERFVNLSNEEKLIALYCLTSPQCNRIGLFRFSVAAAAEDLGTLPQTFAKRFANVCHTLNWTFDERSKVLYFPTWWKYNAPDNPNTMKSCLEDLHDVPATYLLARFYANTKYLQASTAERIANVARNVTPNVSPQEQEQEQEQEKEQEQDVLGRPASGRFTPPAIDDVRAYCQERGNSVDAEKFVAFYSAKGWMIGRNKMKDWRQAVITWEKNSTNGQPANPLPFPKAKPRSEML